jgi:ubiquitin-conjugating enzyme E2 T
MLTTDPPFGVAAWMVDNQLNHLNAQLVGPPGTPYEKGIFLVDIVLPDRYPFEPPKARFITPVYHPNVECNSGRICLDTLNMPPKGSWTPSLNISALLAMLRQLLQQPNGDDGLMHDVTQKYKFDRQGFDAIARKWTLEHATGESRVVAAASSSSSSSSSSPQETKQPTALNPAVPAAQQLKASPQVQQNTKNPSSSTNAILEPTAVTPAVKAANSTTGASVAVEEDSDSEPDDSSDEEQFTHIDKRRKLE